MTRGSAFDFYFPLLSENSYCSSLSLSSVLHFPIVFSYFLIFSHRKIVRSFVITSWRFTAYWNQLISTSRIDLRASFLLFNFNTASSDYFSLTLLFCRTISHFSSFLSYFLVLLPIWSQELSSTLLSPYQHFVFFFSPFSILFLISFFSYHLSLTRVP